MIESQRVAAIRELAARGLSSRDIARRVGVARNTVLRYLKARGAAGVQVRPAARRLSEDDRDAARRLFAGNAVVVHRLLRQRGVNTSLSTVQRAVADLRPALRTRSRIRDESTITKVSVSSEDAQWAMDLVQRLASKHDGRNGDLEATLTYRARLIANRGDQTQNWRGYLFTVLTNETKSWLNERARRITQEISLDQPIGDEEGSISEFISPRSAEDPAASSNLTSEHRRLLARARRHLTPKLRTVFDTLRRTYADFDHSADLLGIEKRTLRRLIRRIRARLKRRGLIFP